MLAPLPRKSVSSDSHDFIDLNAQSPAGSTSPELKETQMHVLLRVSLKENKFDLEVLKDWIMDAPDLAEQIKVICTMPSFSTLIILRVPVEVWDMLPANPAMSFIGFTTISDTAVPLEGIVYDPGQIVQNSAVSESPASDLDDVGAAKHSLARTAGKAVAPAIVDDEKSMVAILDSVDLILPDIFHELRHANTSGVETMSVASVLGRLMEELERRATISRDFDLESMYIPVVCAPSPEVVNNGT
jgi:hypothetical protein